MSLKEIQNVLALIYTDKEFRNTFFNEPENTGVSNELTIAEINILKELPQERLNFFATSLQSKRLNQVIKLLPFTHKFLGKKFIDLFISFSSTYNPTGIKKHQDDAIKFSEYLQSVSESPVIAEISRYEAIYLKAWHYPQRIIIGRFYYPVDQIIKYNNLEPKKQKLTIIFWYRFFKQDKL